MEISDGPKGGFKEALKSRDLSEGDRTVKHLHHVGLLSTDAYNVYTHT